MVWSRQSMKILCDAKVQFVFLGLCLFNQRIDAFSISSLNTASLMPTNNRMLSLSQKPRCTIPRLVMSRSEVRSSEHSLAKLTQWSRKEFILGGLLFFASQNAFGEGGDKLYKGPSAYGFEFRYPVGWVPNKKLGNRHLYDLEVRSGDGSGTIGITIDQITSNSTEQWSSLDDAAEGLRAQYEKQGGQKASVKTKRSEREASGLTYYFFEVELEGGARFLTKLTTTAQATPPHPSLPAPLMLFAMRRSSRLSPA